MKITSPEQRQVVKSHKKERFNEKSGPWADSVVTICLEPGNMPLFNVFKITLHYITKSSNSVLSKSKNHVVDFKDLEDLEDLLKPLPVVVVTGVHLVLQGDIDPSYHHLLGRVIRDGVGALGGD